VPQGSRHRPWMLLMELVLHPGHAEVGTAVPPSCRGVGVCSSAAPLCPPNPAVPFTPKLPSPQFLRSPRREGGTARQREASPSVFNAPAAGAGLGACGFPRCGGAVGRGGMGCMWGQAVGHTGAVTPTEEEGPGWHLLLLPAGRVWSSLPSRAARHRGHYANPSEIDASINYVPVAQLLPGQAGHWVPRLLAQERWVCAGRVSPAPVPWVPRLLPPRRCASCGASPGQPCSPSPWHCPAPGVRSSPNGGANSPRQEQCEHCQAAWRAGSEVLLIRECL